MSSNGRRRSSPAEPMKEVLWGRLVAGHPDGRFSAEGAAMASPGRQRTEQWTPDLRGSFRRPELVLCGQPSPTTPATTAGASYRHEVPQVASTGKRSENRRGKRWICEKQANALTVCESLRCSSPREARTLRVSLGGEALSMAPGTSSLALLLPPTHQRGPGHGQADQNITNNLIFSPDGA